MQLSLAQDGSQFFAAVDASGNVWTSTNNDSTWTEVTTAPATIASVTVAGQQAIERVFRGLKDGDWLNWDPMHHWTDRKIRIHTFYCMLGISLLHQVHKQAQAAWADLSIEQLLEELQQIKQFVLLYPPQGEKGPARTAYVLSQQTLAQQALVKTLGLERLHRSTPRG